MYVCMCVSMCIPPPPRDSSDLHRKYIVDYTEYITGYNKNTYTPKRILARRRNTPTIYSNTAHNTRTTCRVRPFHCPVGCPGVLKLSEMREYVKWQKKSKTSKIYMHSISDMIAYAQSFSPPQSLSLLTQAPSSSLVSATVVEYSTEEGRLQVRGTPGAGERAGGGVRLI